ncbi:MAG: T9SS type A sorting domain-containing protein [Bacteroidales bacterium]|nr:T9SS type A sorting domain-containing protein [Bacteroidales bacterium]
MIRSTSKFNLRSIFSVFSIAWVLSIGLLFSSEKTFSQTINDPYCISEFSRFSDKVTEMTVDWDNNLIYFTGEHIFGRLYKVGLNGTASVISTNFANSAAVGLLHNYISTDIVFYNDSIFTNSEGSLIVVDLDPTVTSSNPYTFPGDNGAEAGMAVVGDKIYTTDGKGSANAIYEYDLATNTSSIVVSGLPSDTLHGLEYCEATGKLYLAISPLGIYEVDVVGGTYTLVTDPLPNISRSNFAVDPTGQYAFVHAGTTVHRYNLSTGVGEVFASGLLATNFCDLKFGPSSKDPSKYSLYIGGNDRIYEATGFVPATSADTPTLSATQPVICPLGLPSTTISIGATDKLNGASAWYLYSGSCGGTLIASNTTGIFTVSPTTTTTYYVRGEGECNVAPGNCGSITIIYGNIQPPITSITHVSCNGESNGEIEIFANGGTPPYVYSINNGADFYTTNVFTGLASGDYKIVVQESNGCINVSDVTLTEPDPLSFTYLLTDVSCNAGNDGLIEITATGGLGAGYEYSMDGGNRWQVSNKFTLLTEGTYSLVVRDRKYNYPIKNKKVAATITCATDPVEVVIQEPTAITFESEQTEVSCFGGNDGAITLTASGGIGGNGSGTYQYSIDGGSTWQDEAVFNGLIAGEYPLAVRDKESTTCIVTGETLIITQPTALAFTTTKLDINCYGGNEGEIIVDATGGEGGAGSGTYEYSNDNGDNWQTTNTFSNLVAGDYEIVVRDALNKSCLTVSKTVSIEEPTELSFTFEQQNISCNGNNHGEITLIASGGIGGNGSGTYEYSIDGGLTWQTDDTFSNLLAGSYNAKIRDRANVDCSSEVTVVKITQADPLTFTNSLVDVSCNGGNNGSITVNAQGGSGSGFDYSNNNGTSWQKENIFSNLPAGDYQVLIRDQANTDCISTIKTVRIEEPTAIQFTYSQHNVSCNEGNDGSISITAEGGVGGDGSGTYQYSIDNGKTWQDSNIFTGLSALTYSALVRDAVNTDCFTDSKSIIITQPSPINVITTTKNISCNGGSDGQIEITATGGEGGSSSGLFAYSIDGGTNWQTTNVFPGLSAGTFAIAVRDQSNVNCVQEGIEVTLTQPTLLDFTTQAFGIVCNGDNSGKIIVTASGGVGGAGSGTYQYSIDGGYSWKDSNVFENLFAANYQVVVRDKVNTYCSSDSKEVQIQESDPITFTYVQHDVGCAGSSDGRVEIIASGGSGAGYVYSNNGGSSYQASNIFENLSANRYTFIVAEKGNEDCTSEPQRLTITQPTPISFTTEKVDVSCYECSNGVISVLAIGGEGGSGTGLYQYSNDGGLTWQDASMFTELIAGTYQIMVRDRSNTSCEIGPQEVILTQPTPLTFTTTQINLSCFGDSNGQIQITASGGLGGTGSGTYQYSIDDGINWSDSNIFTGLIAGNYVVRVRDKVNTVNVTEAEIVEITQPSKLEFSFTKQDVTCNGSNDGSISFEAVGGIGGNGSGAYSYSVNGGNSWQDGALFSTLYSGEYQLVLRDKVNVSCQTEAEITEITEPDLLEITVLKKDANCSTNDDGEIHISTFGGEGGASSATFQYTVNGGASWQDSPDFSNLVSGNYLVGARDKINTNCGTPFQDIFIDLISPINLDYSITEINCFGNNNGIIDMTGLGGSGYEFTIDGGTNWQSSGLFESLYAGEYTIATREQTNPLCGSDQIAVLITEPTEIRFTYQKTNSTCVIGNDGEIQIEAQGAEGGAGSGTFDYTIDGGLNWQSSGLFSNLISDDYELIVRDRENPSCETASVPVHIFEYSTIKVSATPQNLSCYNGNDGSIFIVASGGTDYEYSINNGATWSGNALFSNLEAGSYTLVVREQALADCYTEPLLVELEQPTQITFTVAQSNISCFEGNDGAIMVLANGGDGGLGTATYEYSIDGGTTWQANNRFLNLTASSYLVTVRDLGVKTCQTESKEIILTEPTEISFTVHKTDLACFGSDRGVIELILTGGTGGGASEEFEFSIDNGANWQDSNLFENLSSGTYQAVVRNKNNNLCQSSSTEVVLNESSPLAFTYTYNDADCGTNNDGQISILAEGGSGSYQYSINNGSSWQDSNEFTGLSAAFYTTLIRDKASPLCLSDSQEIKIRALSPITFTYDYYDVTCPGAADGGIDFMVDGGATYEFSIDNGITWQSSSVFYDLSGGNYQLVIRDQAAPLCESATTDIELYEAEPLLFTFEKRDESCNAKSDGKIEFFAQGGESETYQYTIDNGATWFDSPLFEDLSAGVYNLNIRDKDFNDCQSAGVQVTLIKASAIGFESKVTHISCNGSNDGEIELTMTVGALDASYEYTINNGTNWQPLNVFTNLRSSLYAAKVRETGTTVCQSQVSYLVLSEPLKITLEITKKDESCEAVNDGQIVISASPDGSYEFSIDGGNTYQTSNLFNNIGIGTYAVSARKLDNIDCTSETTTVVIEKKIQLDFSVSTTNLTCNGSDDGTITVGLGIGSDLLDYEFSKDNGLTWQESNVFTGLAPETYSVLLRKKAGSLCLSYPVEVSITEPLVITFTVTIINESCGGLNDGSIVVKAKGGSALVYNYSKDNGLTWQTSSTLSGLGVGTYQVLVSDRINTACLSEMAEFTVGKESELIFTESITNVSCSGGNDGSIIVALDASVPVANYEYSINAGVTWQLSKTFSNLVAGNYAVLVRRAGGTPCQTAHEVSVLQPVLINFTVVKSDLTCSESADGTIAIAASGGVSENYQYSINDGASWQDDSNFEGLEAGAYLVVVRHKVHTSCQSSPQNVVLNAPPSMSLSVSKLDLWCNGSADGEITASGNGGVGALSYSIDGGLTYQSSGVFTGLDAGEYTVAVKDANGCELFYDQNPLVLLQPQGVLFSNVNLTYGNCDGGLGSIEIIARSVFGSVLYSIDNGVTYQVDNYFGDLSSGSYEIMVKELDGCENAYAENPVNLTLASELTVQIKASPDDNICTFYPVVLTAEGPDIELFNWSTGETTESIVYATETAGSYYFTVDVVSKHGCEASDDLVLNFNQGSAISITATPNDTACTKDIIQLTATADDAVSYLWKPDNMASNTIDVQKFDAGEFMYFVEVMNSTGCISLDSIPLVFKDCTGLNELDTDGIEIEIYPNPSKNNQFNVQIKGIEEDVEVWIIDFDGRILLEDKMFYHGSQMLQKEYNLPSFERGVYFIRLANKDKVSYKRIILM